jgi:arylsulfatase A-like enzyme
MCGSVMTSWIIVTCFMPSSSLVVAQSPPHIVVILADDLGWTDLSTGSTSQGNGSPYYRTPHLDALAEAGASFTNAYSNGPNCAPTRAALWSGQWAARTGIYTVVTGNRGKASFRKLKAAENQRVLSPSVVTLAETMRAAGYATAHFGKWHLGNKKNHASPTDQGFEFQAGGDQRGGVGKIRHFADDQGAFPIPGLAANGKPKQFMADRLTDEAIAWMGKSDKPVFCCISHYSVHTPIQAPAVDFEATPEAPNGSRHKNRRYAAMMKNLDDNVGRVMAFLADKDDPMSSGAKMLSNTLVLFTSDNGGLGGYQAAGVSGGLEVTNQLPLRSGKGSLHEGGTRVPFIARWDGKIVPGSVDATPLQSFDLYPTLVSVAGAVMPTDHVVDGVDLSCRLQAEPQDLPPRALFWHFPGYLEANTKQGTFRTTPTAVVRRGDLKAMYWFESRSWSLFDLDADINESENLSAKRPEDLARLAAELRQWLVATKAPMPIAKSGEAVELPDLPN